MNQLQSYVDRMKHVGDLLNVSISKYGDLLITLGAEFWKLLVIGDKAQAAPEDQNLSAQSRSQRAILRGDAQSVQVSVRHFSKSLQCHLAKPDSGFYGIVPPGGLLTVIFQFFIPGTRQTDKSISLHCRIELKKDLITNMLCLALECDDMSSRECQICKSSHLCKHYSPEMISSTEPK